MNSLPIEIALIGSVLAVTITAGYFPFKNTEGNTAQQSEKVLIGFLGVFMLMGGAVKFF